MPVAGEWPPEGLEQVERCPACGSDSREVVYTDLTDRSYRCAPGRWRLVRCANCCCAYLDPRPDEQTAHIAYANYYDGAQWPSEPTSLGAWRRSRRALRNGYLNSRYGYAIAPAARLGRLIVPFLGAYRDAADEYVRHLRLPAEQPRRLFDVGCGEGDFLATMQTAGWSVAGVDPALDAVRLARARGVPVSAGTIMTVPLETASLDAITFRLVFEHLGEPRRVLEVCRRALKAGGLLWIATPNLDSEGHRIFGEHWIHLQPPRHAVIYTPTSLARLLSTSGFELSELRASRQAKWSFRMSAALARGAAPFSQPPRLPLRLGVQARRADMRAHRRPDKADIMIVIARAA
jgi:SAM-dependent methyltransferase